MSGRNASSGNPFWRRCLLTSLLLLMAAGSVNLALLELRTRWREGDVARIESGVGLGIAGSDEAVEGAQAGALGVERAFDRELRARALSIAAERAESSAATVRLLRQARDELRFAARQRPAWPYVWAELADVKSQAGSFDGEFRQAFRRALSLGPHETRILRQLLDIVLRHEDRIAASLSEETRQIVLTLAQREPGRVIEQASRYHLAGWLCVSDASNAALIHACGQRGFAHSTERLP